MKTLSYLCLAVVLSATQILAAKPAYDGLVMTSIDVKRPDPNNPKRVEFCGRIRGNEKDSDAVILTNVVEVRREGWKRVPIFQADEVDISEVKKSIKKPLLCIHGFNVQPESHLEQCRTKRHEFKNFDLIPVIWPSTGGIYNYWGDRGYSKGAGKALRQSMEKYAGMFPRKSLLAHSMGNRVLRYAADSKYMFDNIFMCAADVDNKRFDEKYINNDSEERRKDGLRLKDMLNDSKSRIHVLHNRQDYALTGSTVTKGFTGRLGASGARVDKLHPELVGKVQNLNCGDKWLNWGLNFAAHSYQFDKEAIAYFDANCI